MFPIPFNFPFRKKDGSITTINKAIEDGSVLPVASATKLGGVKVGDNLSIDANGKLSASGGGNVFTHQLVFQHGTNTARKVCVTVCTSSATPITKDDAFDIIYNDGAPITLYGVSVGTTATFGISANMDGTTERFAYIDSSGSNNNAVSSTVFSDTVFEM